MQMRQRQCTVQTCGAVLHRWRVASMKEQCVVWVCGVWPWALRSAHGVGLWLRL
jgi:hypothetical protein